MQFNKTLKLNESFYEDTVKVAVRDGFGVALNNIGADKNLVVLSADLSESVKASEFAKKFPDKYIEVGVAEQNMAGIGAGLALAGKTPFITSFSVFNPMRNFDQIRVSVAYSNLNVKILGSHSGFSNGKDGASHQALEDVALMRVLPNMSVVCACDHLQMTKLVEEAFAHKGPVYIRSFKEPTTAITTKNTPTEFGKAQVIAEGKDLCIVSSGPILVEVLKAVKDLEESQKISVEVLNMHTIKPLDTKQLLASAKKCGKVVVVEEHQVSGGLGGTVAEFLSEHNPLPIKIIGVEDTFGESGTYQELLTKYGLDSKAISTKVLQFLQIC